jgi:hypothetical protein
MKKTILPSLALLFALILSGCAASISSQQDGRLSLQPCIPTLHQSGGSMQVGCLQKNPQRQEIASAQTTTAKTAMADAQGSTKKQADTHTTSKQTAPLRCDGDSQDKARCTEEAEKMGARKSLQTTRKKRWTEEISFPHFSFPYSSP